MREQHHGLVEHAHVVEAAAFGAFAFVMNDLALGEVMVLTPGFYELVAKVDIFPIHEVLGIKPAHLA
ncbi:MAG: hypothetical protein L7U78_01085 [Schleiferiaceae bacterium]|nr:hypothetical protein [Schleiferiaceae bacterium]